MATVTEVLRSVQAVIFLSASDVCGITKNAFQKYEFCRLEYFEY
jgi:hypothetical protein